MTLPHKIGEEAKHAVEKFLVEAPALSAAIRYQGLRAEEQRTVEGASDPVPVYRQEGGLCEAVGRPHGGYDVSFIPDRLDPTMDAESRNALSSMVMNTGNRFFIPPKYENIVSDYLLGKNIQKMEARELDHKEPLFHVQHYTSGGQEYALFDLNQPALEIMGALARSAAAGRVF